MPHASPGPVHYLPILTTLLSAAFLAVIVVRAARRRWPPHLVWWGIGVLAYGLGTALESLITLNGNTPLLNRLWYWAGAILGGYPLATGTVYLLLRRRTAHALTFASLLVVLFASVMVLFVTGIDATKLEPHRPSGAVLTLSWVRLLTPVINLYAAVFLIGGAAYSSWRFAFPSRGERDTWRAVGTLLIAVGALLPGIGGAMAKAGKVEALYVGELAGIVLIWAGYAACTRAPIPVTRPMVVPVAATA